MKDTQNRMATLPLHLGAGTTSLRLVGGRHGRPKLPLEQDEHVTSPLPTFSKNEHGKRGSRTNGASPQPRSPHLRSPEPNVVGPPVSKRYVYVSALQLRDRPLVRLHPVIGLLMS